MKIIRAFAIATVILPITAVAQSVPHDTCTINPGKIDSESITVVEPAPHDPCAITPGVASIAPYKPGDGGSASAVAPEPAKLTNAGSIAGDDVDVADDGCISDAGSISIHEYVAPDPDCQTSAGSISIHEYVAPDPDCQLNAGSITGSSAGEAATPEPKCEGGISNPGSIKFNP